MNELAWVEFEPRPGQQIAFFERYNRMGLFRAWARAQAAAQVLGQGASFERFAEILDELCEMLTALVADWDLEDEAGQPLPKPTRKEAFYDLTLGEDGEIAWIMGALGKRLNPDPKS
jgi:hypothetical protein